MATPNLRAEVRPISFILHDTTTGELPTKLDLVIRPEDLSRPDVSRATVHHTLGGAWADSWGAGIPSVNISGTTGWGQGGRENGLEQFLLLHHTVFNQWHVKRESAISNGFNPDDVKLIFCDELDEFTWVVLPSSFVLRRNKSRPLLAQYSISLQFLDDGVKFASAAESALLKDLLGAEGFGLFSKVKDSLQAALAKIKNFASKIKSAVGAVLGPIQKAVATFTALTATAVEFVQSAIGEGLGVVRSVTNPLVNIAGNLSRAAANVTNMISSGTSLPQMLKAEFQRVSSAFTNVFCLIKNALGGAGGMMDFSDLYGASTCSSTAGGRPLSPYDSAKNPFPALMPVNSSPATVSSSAAQAINRLASADVLSPPSMNALQADMQIAVNGTTFQAAA